MNWIFNATQPIYLQIVNIIENQILTGIYESGAKLPSVRDFASEAKVNPNTVQKAMGELEKKQILYTSNNNGRYVTQDTKIIQQLREEKTSNLIKEFFENAEKLNIKKEIILEKIKDYKEKDHE